LSDFLPETVLTKPGTVDPYTAADLWIGETVDVCGRLFLIVDADPATKLWYQEHVGARDGTPIDVGSPSPDETSRLFDKAPVVLGYSAQFHRPPDTSDIARIFWIYFFVASHSGL
jgi:hypothetical protein